MSFLSAYFLVTALVALALILFYGIALSSSMDTKYFLEVRVYDSTNSNFITYNLHVTKAVFDYARRFMEYLHSLITLEGGFPVRHGDWYQSTKPESYRGFPFEIGEEKLQILYSKLGNFLTITDVDNTTFKFPLRKWTKVPGKYGQELTTFSSVRFIEKKVPSEKTKELRELNDGFTHVYLIFLLLYVVFSLTLISAY